MPPRTERNFLIIPQYIFNIYPQDRYGYELKQEKSSNVPTSTREIPTFEEEESKSEG